MNDKELIRAVNVNDIKKVRELLPKISTELLNQLHDSRTPEGDLAAIHVAAYKGHIEILELIIKDPRTNLHIKTSQSKCDALQMAAQSGQLEACTRLLPVSNVINLESKRAYFLAVEGMRIWKDTEKGKRCSQIADLLRMPTFIEACDKGHLNIIKTMVEEGTVDINAVLGKRWGLERACRKLHLDVVDYLLSLPEIDLETTYLPGSYTVLHLMCVQKTKDKQLPPLQDCNFYQPSVRFQIIDKLIKSGANPNARDADGFTPLFLATAYNLLDAVKALLIHNADLNIKYKQDTSLFATGEAFSAYKERISLFLQSNPQVYEKFKSLVSTESALDQILKECTDQKTLEFDIFYFAQNHPQILRYLRVARQYGGGTLGEFRASSEIVHSLLFTTHSINRLSGSVLNSSAETVDECIAVTATY